MNATQPNSSVLSLFSMLGQTPDSGLSALMDTEGGGDFSALMSTLMPEDLSLDSALPATVSPLSLLQTLPQDDQALPLLPTALPGLPEEALPTADAGVDDLLGQIRQAQEPLAYRPLSAPLTEADQEALADSTDDDTSDALTLAGLSPEDAASAVLVGPPPPPAMADAVGDAMTADDGLNIAAGEGRRRPDLPQGGLNNAAAPADDAETAVDLTASDASDFYMADDKPVSADKASSMTQSLFSAQNAQSASSLTTSAQTQAQTTVPLTATAVAADSATTPTTAADVSADLTASTDELSEGNRLLHTRDKLDFGQDRREWGGALGARIVTMVADDVKQARIQLDPPELGSLEIKLHMNQDQATIQVQTQNPQVREVLESSAHRLRDALASQGINLSGFDVSDQGSAGTGSAGGESGQPGEGGYAANGWSGDEELADSEQTSVSTHSHSLLDTFA
ncbi:flagellar hook-length control protein FliK [Thalassolituus sp. LLYu03]|uniref:flagellar hook-length control protein FliK n=1 Tax=Thalassolituus sp. LLYu03 TaxID=3421656 RepID=UPI003D2ABE9D